MNLNIKKHAYTVKDFSLAFLKWVFVAALCGAIGGLIGAAFDKSVGYVTNLFNTYSWLIFLLPLGGIVIVFLYRICKMDESVGTNNIINSVRTGNGVPI
ncbi:MAG: chloride channel protein, partial [Acutalibacteraceae bacterium]